MYDKKFLPVIIFVLGIILLLGWYELIYAPAQSEILNMELETRRLREVEREILELKDRLLTPQAQVLLEEMRNVR